MRISARNRLKGTIVEVTKGVTTAHVRIDIGGSVVTASMRRPMADHSPSTVRSAALRSSALSLEKAISIDGVDGSCSRRCVGA